MKVLEPPVQVVRILVIDDEPGIRKFLERGLGLAGFVVQSAANGEAGLAAVVANPPDLVLLDLMMPGHLDGFATLAQLVLLEPRPKVIVLSGRDEPEDRRLAASADVFLVKPVVFDLLLNIIAGLTEKPNEKV